jgi:hypothetical protein
MISALELALNHLDDVELTERIDGLESLLVEAHAILAEQDGHVLLIATPPPPIYLPWLPDAVA